MKKIIFMSVVITLFAITATSCVLGFQSAKIQFKMDNTSTADIKYTITDNDDRFFIPDVTFTASAGGKTTSDATIITWLGYNQEIKDAKIKIKIVTGGESSNEKYILKKDIKASLNTTEIDLSNSNDYKLE